MNYGNPEKPDAFSDFEQGIKGVAEAAKALWQIGTDQEPVPIVSGNVSFYNESSLGKAIKPSPIVACVGTMEDYTKCVSKWIKHAGNMILLIGHRRNEMGGTAYHEICHKGKPSPAVTTVDFQQECIDMHGTAELLDQQLAAACHDISDGGFLTALVEMFISHRKPPNLGAQLEIHSKNLSGDQFLFTESGGFILEIPSENQQASEDLLRQNGVSFAWCGTVTNEPRIDLTFNGVRCKPVDLNAARDAWISGLEDVIS